MAFVCRLCGVVWPSAELLTEHFVVHAKQEHGWAHRRFAMPPAAAPRPVMPPILRAPPPAMAPAQLPLLPHFLLMSTMLSLAPPRPTPAAGVRLMAVVVPAAPAPPPVQRPASPPGPGPFVGPGNTIRMVPFRPNPAFWARYRLGLEPFVEYLSIDRPRPASPSPSFEDWIQADHDADSSEDEE
ncbi:hypothetical protein GQ55_1G364300 [Panicum hallii var. hallii]|uniref:C2H2-type domain-containing protein n=1 Tax=Panicum hallii var. hallii TaxID=1504633 RepID=A0A2T7FB99_9POAL|nr:hypothetical protein GQ55_1G364300 [Panicum hallii var. hallii]